MNLGSDLQARIEEVELYFDFVKSIDSVETYRTKTLKTDSFSVVVKRDLQKVLRANCFLILYNLIESTIRNGIFAIYDSVEDKGTVYKNLSHQIQNVWLLDQAHDLSQLSNLNKTKNSVKKLVDEVISNSSVKFSRTRISLSGNLDYRTIEKLIVEYGFHGKITVADKSKLGKALLRIKHERNNLAHGNKSFRQTSEMITIQELIEYKILTCSYLSDITKNLLRFIENSEYENSIPSLGTKRSGRHN